MTERDTSPPEWVDQLEASLEAFDEAGGHRILGKVFEQLDVEDGLSQVVLPYLHQVGQRWEQGKIGVAQEHFASNVLRVRLSMMLHAERGGDGPVAVLACMPGEQHEFGLMGLALVLSRLDWQICYLGANTPTAEIAYTARTLRPRAVVLSAHRRTAFAAHGPALRRLGRVTQVHIAASSSFAPGPAMCEAQLVRGNPVDGARALHAWAMPSGAPEESLSGLADEVG